MKTKLLSAISAIAIMAAVPALAETKARPYSGSSDHAQGQTTKSTPAITESDIKQGWKDTKQAVSETIDSIKGAVVDENYNPSRPAYVNIDSRMTANGILGKAVVNNQGKKIGDIEDIILDRDGNAKLVLIAHGGFLGVGDKLAAFDYDLVTRRETDGDVIMPLAKTTVDKAVAFSYDPKDASSKVRVVPQDGISVKKLLDAKIVNPAGENVAEVDNVNFYGGRVDRVIIGFDKILGVGGDKALIGFKAMTLNHLKDGGYQFKVSDAQAEQLRGFQKSYSN